VTALTLAAIGTDAREVFGALVKLLQDRKVEVRRAALSAVVALAGKDLPEAVPALAEALKDQDLSMRVLALHTLFELSGDSREALAALGEGLRDRDRRVRFLAVQALVAHQSRGVPLLVQGLKDAEAQTRLLIIVGLAEMGPAATEAVPALQALAKDGQGDTKRLAKLALERVQQ
jgi:HEAT repeat protein